MLTLFAVCTLQFHIALSQFPDHIDFQKEGEVIIKGEKYNILKTTKHVVKDHFLNFMQRRDDDPTKRVFLDNNGLRHYWSGYNDNKNLRKSEGVSNIMPNLENLEVIVAGNDREDTVNNEASKDNSNVQDQRKGEDEGPKLEVDGKIKPKRKPNPEVVDKIIMKPALRTDATNRTLAITYFYCPFFGVMSLSAFVD